MYIFQSRVKLQICGAGVPYRSSLGARRNHGRGGSCTLPLVMVTCSISRGCGRKSSTTIFVFELLVNLRKRRLSMDTFENGFICSINFFVMISDC